MRSYWAGAENLDTSNQISGILDTVFSGSRGIGSSMGFGNIVVQQEKVAYKPGFRFYVGDAANIQQVYYDNCDCPNKAYEDKIWYALGRVEAAKIPYDLRFSNSNSAAFYALKFAGLGKNLSPRKKIPGWDAFIKSGVR